MVQTCTNCLINSSLKQFGAGWCFHAILYSWGVAGGRNVATNTAQPPFPLHTRYWSQAPMLPTLFQKGADGQCANGYVKTNNSRNSRWFISSIICGGYDGDMMGIYPRIWGNRFDLDQHSWWWLVSKTGHETECRGTHMVQLIFRANSAKDLSPQDSMLPGPQVMNT